MTKASFITKLNHKFVNELLIKTNRNPKHNSARLYVYLWNDVLLRKSQKWKLVLKSHWNVPVLILCFFFFLMIEQHLLLYSVSQHTLTEKAPMQGIQPLGYEHSAQGHESRGIESRTPYWETTSSFPQKKTFFRSLAKRLFGPYVYEGMFPDLIWNVNMTSRNTSNKLSMTVSAKHEAWRAGSSEDYKATLWFEVELVISLFQWLASN